MGIAAFVFNIREHVDRHKGSLFASLLSIYLSRMHD